MKIYGNMNFNLNHALGFVIEPYDGSSQPFPSDAKIGRIIFRTDNLQVYVCISTNPVVWQPIIKVANSYVHEQTENNANWIIVHDLATTNVLVHIYDNNNQSIIPDSITINSDTQVTVGFSQPISGKALVIAVDTQIGSFIQYNSLSQDVLKSKLPINNITYNSDNNPTRVDYSDGTYVVLTYNTDKNVDEITFYNQTNAVIEKWKYNYDTQKRLISTQKLV